MPIARSRSARPWLTAISASPFEFSYQKAAPGGRSLKVFSRSSSRPAAAILALGTRMADPVMALPKMVDVDDLTEVVRPVCAAIRAIPPRLAGWWLAERQNGCDRCEEVAPVKAGREPLRPPVDIPTACLCGTALNQLKQAVAGTGVPPAVGLKHNGRARPADAGIDEAEKAGCS